MNAVGPCKAERVAGVVLCAACIVGAVIFAVWSRSLFSIIYAVAAIILLSLSLWRSRNLREEEIIRRQDEAMKSKDDPHEMARFVP